MARAVDWGRLDAIRADYIAGKSYTELSRAYGLSRTSIARRGAAEGWAKLRDECVRKSNEKIVSAVSSQRAEAALSALSAADELLEAIVVGIRTGAYTSDASSVRQVAAAIKDIMEMRGEMSSAAAEERRLKLDKLRAEVDAINTAGSGPQEVRVVLGAAEEYAE